PPTTAASRSRFRRCARGCGRGSLARPLSRSSRGRRSSIGSPLMERGRTSSTRLLAMAALAGGYVIAGKLGLTLAFVNASATAVWPPTGLAIASLLLWGIDLWPAVLVGAFVVNLTTSGDVLSSV